MTPMIFALIMTMANAKEVTLGRYNHIRNCIVARDAILESSKWSSKPDYDTLECRALKFNDVIYE